MKNLLTSLLIASGLVSAKADIVTYEYDAAGNRVLKVVMQAIQPQTISEGDILHENEMLKDKTTSTLEYDGNQIVLTIPAQTIDGKARIIICNLDGIILELANTSATVNKFNISGYAPGCYIVIVEHDGESESWKLIKKP